MSETIRLSIADYDLLYRRCEYATQQGVLVREYKPTYTINAMFRGVRGGPVSHKWTVIFHQNRFGHPGAIVCTDNDVLRHIWRCDLAALQPSDRPVVVLDDAGWGFPLLGLMVGAECGGQVLTDVVPVDFFRHDVNTAKDAYLDDFAERGMRLIGQLNASKETHRAEVCTGHANKGLRERLRAEGWEMRVVEVAGVLQDTLEDIYKHYVLEQLGVDLYYDPKVMDPRDIGKAYNRAVAFGARNVPHLLKTSWKALYVYRRSADLKKTQGGP